ncbi:AraC family transcriptional regulator [Parendozoicomonas sp. Alg238-R29]|uniref:AraC family transcriptional regulator n=1 Tax=Parendozoicomonas sp. Alg238-R29 TaxID=2993446 RepID=UPI00248E0A39|nr:AraC family transcriptional regulator [Parendozoicomonas sp. Alg238-R29]
MIEQAYGSIGDTEVFQDLADSRARLLNSITLKDALGFAYWANGVDEVNYKQPQHHTLSCYVSGGYKVKRVMGAEVAGGSAPEKLCLMPSDHEYIWKINDDIRLLHFYFSDKHLGELGEKVWDKSLNHLSLDDKTFLEDPYLATIFLQMVNVLNWQDRADQISLQSSSQMLMVHLLKNHCSRSFQQPRITGGLTHYQVRRVREYILEHLGADLSLASLAEQTGLSEYHFARMFKETTGLTPHQFVTQERVNKSKELIGGGESLASIALQVGFSSQSHFSTRFRQVMNVSPAQFRKSVFT